MSSGTWRTTLDLWLVTTNSRMNSTEGNARTLPPWKRINTQAMYRNLCRYIAILQVRTYNQWMAFKVQNCIAYFNISKEQISSLIVYIMDGKCGLWPIWPFWKFRQYKLQLFYTHSNKTDNLFVWVHLKYSFGICMYSHFQFHQQTCKTIIRMTRWICMNIIELRKPLFT